MPWRYSFDGGPEKDLACDSSLYARAAMAAFSREEVTLFPTINVPGFEPYRGHQLKLWDPALLPDYGPYFYGIGYNQCGGLTITSLNMSGRLHQRRPFSLFSISSYTAVT